MIPNVFHHASRVILALICALTCRLTAETIAYAPGVAIDVPVPIASTDHEVTRVVTLPCAEISQIGMSATPHLQAQKFHNRVQLRLTNPAFEATVSVWDESNNLFLLTVRSQTSDDLVDSELIVRKSSGASSDPSATGTARAILQDTDQAVINLFAEMEGGQLNPGTSWMAVTSVERGRPMQGRRLFADDNLEIRLMRMYRAPGLYGYECIATWHGKQAATLDIQRLKPRKAIAVSASEQAFLPRVKPNFILPGDRTMRLWYVCGE